MHVPGSDYFPIHVHSEFSCLDGMGSVERIVAKALADGRPAISLTDHGTMAGSLRLYSEAKKHGLAAYPGSEFYLVSDVGDPVGKNKRYHLGMLAFTYHGFQGLLRLSSRSHQRDRFHRKPLIDFDDLAEFSDTYGNDVVVTTGCYFGIIVQTLKEGGVKRADMMIDMLASWFPHLSVEVQFHNIPRAANELSEKWVNKYLFDVAHRKGLPVVLGQDSHYCDAEDQPVHDLMKDICYFGDGEDNRFPGGPYHMATVDELRGNWSPRRWERIEEGHTQLLNLHALTMPALDNYKFHVPKVSKNADKEFARLVRDGWDEMVERDLFHPNLWEDYHTQIDKELHVIKTMGMADYFLLAKYEVIDWCKDNGVVVNCRGSVNGSLTCFLTGITKVDPILWGTSFDRFLTLDRKKPPDIDFDVESRFRYKLIDHLRKRFPTLVQIGTYSGIGITGQEDEDGYGEDTGSVFVQYKAAMRRKLGAKYDGGVLKGHREALNGLSDAAVRKSMGVHAAGLVLPTEDLPIDAYLATGLVASSNTTVTQAVMEDVESAGYMKLDILGLRALETLNGALVNAGYAPDTWDWMPWNDKRACGLLSSGMTDGIFQFEGYATRIGGKEMKVRNTMDAIICLALYRPALMNGGQKDMYLTNRGEKKPNWPHKLHPFFDKRLDVTSGVAVFQEQVMEMCADLEMPFAVWNDLLTAVKASNDKIDQYGQGIMKRTKPIFLALCAAKGIDKRSALDAWATIVGFTDYGFNRAHATSYGLMSYRSAYLKVHYPLEYMQALLATWAGTKKEMMYMREARRMGIAIGRADVNASDVVWTIDKSKKSPTLRKGLTTLPGIGSIVAQSIVDHRPEDGWDTMDDFVAAVPPRPVTGGKEWAKTGFLNGIMAILRDQGALMSLGIDPG